MIAKANLFYFFVSVTDRQLTNLIYRAKRYVNAWYNSSQIKNQK